MSGSGVGPDPSGPPTGDRRYQREGLDRVSLHEASALELPLPVLRPGGRLVLSNMTKGERRRHRVWDALYARGINLTANCRGVLAAPVLEELGFSQIRREYMAQMGFPTEIVTAMRP